MLDKIIEDIWNVMTTYDDYEHFGALEEINIKDLARLRDEVRRVKEQIQKEEYKNVFSKAEYKLVIKPPKIWCQVCGKYIRKLSLHMHEPASWISSHSIMWRKKDDKGRKDGRKKS